MRKMSLKTRLVLLHTGLMILVMCIMFSLLFSISSNEILSNVQNTLASVYAESEDSLNKAIVHSVTACRLLETSGFPTHNCREDLEQFKEQLKGYYQTDTRDMTDEGFELWYQGQMDSE